MFYKVRKVKYYWLFSLLIILTMKQWAIASTNDNLACPEGKDCSIEVMTPTQYYMISVTLLNSESNISKRFVYDMENPGIQQTFDTIDFSLSLDKLSNLLFNLNVEISESGKNIKSNVVVPFSKVGVIDIKDYQLLLSVNEVPIYMSYYLDKDLAKGLIQDYFKGNYQAAANLLAVQCPVYEQAIGRVSNVYYYCDFMLANSLLKMSKFEAAFIQFEDLYHTIPEIAPTANIKRAMVLSKLAEITTKLKGTRAADPYVSMGQQYLANSSGGKEVSGVLSDFFGSKAALEASFQ